MKSQPRATSSLGRRRRAVLGRRKGFTWINWIKMPFFVAQGVVTRETLLTGLCYLPLIPVGVWTGVWLNRKFSEKLFLRLVYGFTLLTAVQLIFNFDLARLFR